MCAVVFDISEQKDSTPLHPVRIINPANNKIINLDAVSDSGSQDTWISNSYVRQLSFDSSQVIPSRVTAPSLKNSNIKVYKVGVKIGNLTTQLIPVFFGKLPTIGKDYQNVLGRNLLSKFKVTYYFNKIIYEELTPVVKATAALAQLQSSGNRNWRNRI